MVFLKIIAALIALRSAAMIGLFVKNYLNTKRRALDCIVHLLVGALDVLIIFVSIRYIFSGVL